jgi:hypothetical protein
MDKTSTVTVNIPNTPARSLDQEWLELARAAARRIVRPMPERHEAELNEWRAQAAIAQEEKRMPPDLPPGFFLEEEPQVIERAEDGSVTVNLTIAHESQLAV